MEEKESKYQEALNYLYNRLPMFSRTGGPAYKPGLDTVWKLSRIFGNPHEKFRSIHIGGTNGKGSTSHTLASILQEQGYKTALYTSPHLTDFRERIRINGEMIPKENVVEFVNKWKDISCEGGPSFFELTMIMAFNWFAEEKVDYAIIEVGMGGRLDSTNIITPLLSVITNISNDHNQFLGNTLQEIATEKAGIIKAGIPAVIGETHSETENVFLSTAAEKGSSIIFADQTEIPDHIHHTESGWEYKKGNNIYTFPLGGDYQKFNLATVLTAIETLKNNGISITEEAVKNGLQNVSKNTGLLGRWTIISTSPLTIADTGHNEAGIKSNFNQLEKILKKRHGAKLRVVIGFVADKAIDKIIKYLPKDAIYYVTNAQIPRALPSEELYQKLTSEGFKCQKFENVKEAYERAKKDASDKDIIFIGGSTFIVADFFSI